MSAGTRYRSLPHTAAAAELSAGERRVPGRQAPPLACPELRDHVLATGRNIP
ncbi:hypothetical protein [Amycolatopsis plumensis]|uniref:hypothetical protein n=1 Tax=Amycolatopsis plumensis TaxID=236508 RepID=UPI003610CBBC